MIGSVQSDSGVWPFMCDSFHLAICACVGYGDYVTSSPQTGINSTHRFISFCFVALNLSGSDDSENRNDFSNWFITGDTVSSDFGVILCF